MFGCGWIDTEKELEKENEDVITIEKTIASEKTMKTETNPLTETFCGIFVFLFLVFVYKRNNFRTQAYLLHWMNWLTGLESSITIYIKFVFLISLDIARVNLILYFVKKKLGRNDLKSRNILLSVNLIFDCAVLQIISHSYTLTLTHTINFHRTQFSIWMLQI